MTAKVSAFVLLIMLWAISFPGQANAADTLWLAKALQLQREIDSEVPLREATFLGTHNSYNSSAYHIPFLRYIDPNQNLSIDEQLETGVRAIELDVHWTRNNAFHFDFLLCHGKPSHLGCSVYDRPIQEALSEIKEWVSKHPHEVVLLYIERFLDGNEEALSVLLYAYLGDYIYPNPARENCAALPTTLSKADILRTKKQIIIVTKECPKSTGERKNDLWNELVFSGIGQIDQANTFLEAKVTDFKENPDCSQSSIFAADSHHNSLWRIYEDQTHLAQIIRTEKTITPTKVQKLMRCEINWPTFDKLNKDDKRLYATIWSWAYEYPTKDSKGQCAFYTPNEGIKNMDCQKPLASYACYETKSRSWRVIAKQGIWRDGEKICRQYAGKDWHFSLPYKASQLAQLANASQLTAANQVWLNYAVDQKGHWHPKLLKR